MQRHADEGARIIDRLGFLNDAVPAIRHHHERWDGSGYPDRLVGEDIPLGARIIHVADALDSMLTTRIYRAARPAEEALDELRRAAGTQFCPRTSPRSSGSSPTRASTAWARRAAPPCRSPRSSAILPVVAVPSRRRARADGALELAQQPVAGRRPGPRGDAAAEVGDALVDAAAGCHARCESARRLARARRRLSGRGGDRAHADGIRADLLAASAACSILVACPTRSEASTRRARRRSAPACGSATRTSRSSTSCAPARSGSAARRRCASSRRTRRRRAPADARSSGSGAGTRRSGGGPRPAPLRARATELLGVLRELGEELGRTPTARDLDERRGHAAVEVALLAHVRLARRRAARGGLRRPGGGGAARARGGAGGGARAPARPPAEVRRLGARRARGRPELRRSGRSTGCSRRAAARGRRSSSSSASALRAEGTP